jgi:RNA polymerase sigma-70 factor (ECF subfamily)
VADQAPFDPGQFDPGQIKPKQIDPARIDPAAVTLLYERYANELRLFLVGVLRNPDLAAEALQNTFHKAVESGHTAREESLKGWLFQVAFREALLLRRRGQAYERSLREIAKFADTRTDADPSMCPSHVLAQSELMNTIRQALDELPADQREVIRLRIYEEKSFAAIADELAAPLGTVLTRMRLALKRLARRLKTDD